jgi:hypothetical protein
VKRKGDALFVLCNYQLENDEPPEIDIEDKIRKLVLSLCAKDPHTISQYLQQFKQIASGTHQAVPIQAPKVKQNTKGHWKSDKKTATTSTKQNPSAFEVVESNLKKKSASMKRTSTTQRKNSKRMKHDDPSSNEHEDCSIDGSNNSDYDETDAKYQNKATDDADDAAGVEGDTWNYDDNTESAPEDNQKDKNNAKKSGNKHYFSQIPLYLHKYVKDLFDPLGDGNCGFWCIAKALGYDDNGWLQVRNKMAGDIKGNIPTYARLQGGEPAVNQIITNIQVKS